MSDQPRHLAPLPWPLFDRYLAGECTPEQEEQVQTLLASAPTAVQELDALLEELGPPGAEPTSLQARTSLSRFHVTVGRGVPTSPTARKATPRASYRWQWASYIAAFALVLLAIPTLSTLRQRVVPNPVSTAVKEYRTAAGQRARITLADGSTVLLAPLTTLRYSAHFGTSSSRVVTLEGQALFTVTHAAGAPFVVQSGSVATRVLGTSFTVRRYTGDAATKVVVAEGRVTVGPAVLKSGDIALATGTRQVAVSRDNAVGNQLAWTEGRLVFSEVPLRDVIPDLQRWYGLTVEVDDPVLLDRRIAATLDTEAASLALDLIAFTVKGRAELRGSHAIIHSR